MKFYTNSTEVGIFLADHPDSALSLAYRKGKSAKRVAKERARDEMTEDEELAEALANAPGPLNDRDVLELIHAGIVKRV